jgi:hypothetical protein
MRALQELQQTLLGFIDQGEEYMLMLACRDLDVPLCLKVIESVDQEAPQDVFISFGHPIDKDADAYVDCVMENVNTQIVGANVLREQEGLPPWPVLPAACLRGDPAERLNALLDHVGSFWPREEDHRILWSFLPESIGDPKAWATVIAGFFAAKAGHRIFVRSHPQILQVVKEREDLSACLLEVDCSPEAYADELTQRVTNPQTPPDRRAIDLLVLAGMDFSHKRYIESAHKYGVVYEHFTDRPDSEGVQAMCLLGVGDVARQTGCLAIAKDRYRQALVLSATKPDTLAIAMIACSQLGDLCRNDAEYGEAAGYYQLASDIAGKLCNLAYKVDVLEKLGLVQQDLGHEDKARRTRKLARDLLGGQT